MRKLFISIGLLLTLALNAQLNVGVVSAQKRVTASSSTLLNGLISYWNFNEASGTVANDSKDLTNLDIVGATVNQSGKLGQSYSFTGSESDYVGYIHTTYDLEYITIGCWINTTTTGAYQALISNYNSNLGYSLQINDANKVEIQVGNGTAGGYSGGSTTTVTGGAWHLVIGTYDGTNVKIYVDGSMENSDTDAITGPIAYSTSENEHFSIGRRRAGIYYTGYIDEPFIYNRALTQTEVTELWNSGTGKTYPFN